MRLRYTLSARGDLDHIFRTIAEDNPKAALRVETHIRAAIEMLPTWPELGLKTDTNDVRRLPVVRYPYSVFYRLAEGGKEVHILRIFHGRQLRDLDTYPDE